MLRDLVQGVTILLLVCAVLLTAIAPSAWPFLLAVAVLAIGVFYERTFYRGAAAPNGPGWAPTAERFRDQESGAMVTVWYNARTGERRYVEDGGTSPG